MIYNFDTDDHNSATAALIVYAIYRSRDKRRFKVSPEMWGQIERAVKAAAKRDLQDWYESTKAELEKARARVAELERDVEELEALRAPVILRKQAEAVAFSAHLFPEAEQASIRRALYDYAETLRQQAEAAERAREDGGNG